jgi:hypothetical protein
MKYLYTELASLVRARKNCAATGNTQWFDNHTDAVEALVKEHLPSGSGFDSGTRVDLERSTGDKLVFTTSYHHMHESGMYDGWTEHTVTVTASLSSGFILRIGGRNRNDIKELIEQEFQYALKIDLTPFETWEKLQATYRLSFCNQWIGGCIQKWGVLRHDDTVLVPLECSSWIEARDKAIALLAA